MSKECYTRYEVDVQPWERWPRVLVVTEHDPRTGTAQRRYVPEDSVEVVRCRDCKHRVTTIWRECGSEWTEYECNLLRDFGGTPLTIALDGFCAWGERRDGC